MSEVSDEDATSTPATCPQQVVRVGLVEFGERHDTRINGQHYTPQQTADRPMRLARGKLNGEVARHNRHVRHPRSILARKSRVSGVSTSMSRRCYEETASVEVRLYAMTFLQLPAAAAAAGQRTSVAETAVGEVHNR